MAKAFVGIPDWVREESERYRPVFIAYLVDMALFPPEGQPAAEYFDMHGDGWTEEDTAYVIAKFEEHGVISPA